MVALQVPWIFRLPNSVERFVDGEATANTPAAKNNIRLILDNIAFRVEVNQIDHAKRSRLKC
jgi:hypothetical protein